MAPSDFWMDEQMKKHWHTEAFSDEGWISYGPGTEYKRVGNNVYIRGTVTIKKTSLWNRLLWRWSQLKFKFKRRK